MKQEILAILCLVGLVGTEALAGDAGTRSPFGLGAGARDLALGGSALATADPVAAPYWNPSLLARAERLAFGACHSSLYESDVAYQYLGAAIPTMDLGGFGIGLFRLSVGGIEKRNSANVLLGEIDDNRLALYAAYGRSVSGYDVGLSAVLEHHSLDNKSATSSPGLSLSVSRRLESDLWWLPDATASINGRNLIKPGTKLADQTVKEPYSVDAGLSLTLVPSRSRNHTFTVSGALTKVDLVDPSVSLGLEYGLGSMLRVRAGLRDDKASFGIGVSYRSITFDYAMADRDLGSLHMFSIKADIGPAFTDKREARKQRREAEFNDLISTRLSDRNRETVSDLVRRGRQLIEEGDLEQAGVTLDRALFLAGAGGLDSSEVYVVAEAAKRQLESMQLVRHFNAHMDSAQSKFAAGDYLGARYFGDLALAKVPGSPEARDLLQRVDVAIQRSISNDQMVESRLLLADSLLSYGKFEEALVAVSSIGEATRNDNRARMIVRKAEFGNFQDMAEAALARADYGLARSALDSALVRFPSHPWCIGLRSKIEQESRPAAMQRPAPEQQHEPLSEELANEVDEIYKSGQTLFEKGDLTRAVERWQRVERLAPGYMSVRRYLVDAYKFLGVELYTQNKLEEAVGVWKKAADLAPDNADIANYIKRTEAEIERLEELSYEYR
jgi:tetratricopeptide (TPR) repeat protein